MVVFTGSEPDRDHLFGSGGADRFVVKGDIGRLIGALDDLAPESVLRASRWFPAAPSSVREARRFIVEQCRGWVCSDACETAALVVSELVTNAVVHAESPAEVAAALMGSVLRIEVADQSRQAPEVRTLNTASEGGRGMLLVAAMSHAWGVNAAGDGKVVWAEISAS